MLYNVLSIQIKIGNNSPKSTGTSKIQAFCFHKVRRGIVNIELILTKETDAKRSKSYGPPFRKPAGLASENQVAHCLVIPAPCISNSISPSFSHFEQ